MRAGLGRSTTVMVTGTAVSRVLGFLRASLLVTAIGQNSLIGNQFQFANVLPNILYMLVAGGVVNAILVPQIVRAYHAGRGQEYADRLLTVALGLLAAITVLMTLAAPAVIRLFGGVEEPTALHLTEVFAWWCIPQMFFYGLYTLLGQLLNARGSFGPYMWAPVANNVVSIAGFATFIAVFGRYRADGTLADPTSWTAGPVLLVAGSATLGIVVQALVLIRPLRRIGITFRPRRDWRGAGLGTAARVAAWTFAALAAGQVGVLVVTKVANTAGALQLPQVAGNNAYTLAALVVMLPHSLITVSLLTALFTRMSGHAAMGDSAHVRADVDTGIRLITVLTVLAAAVVSVLALPATRVMFWANTPTVAATLPPIVVALSVGLPALGLWSLAQRVHYAYEDARGLFWIQVAMAGVVAAGTILGRQLLPPTGWVAAASASIAVSYVLGAVWGGVTVARRIGSVGSRDTVVVATKALAAMGTSVVVGWPLSLRFGNLAESGAGPAFGVCLLVGVVMLAVYAGTLHVLGVGELVAVYRPALALLRRSMGAVQARAARQHTGGGGVEVEIGQGTVLAGRYRLDHPAPCDLPGAECWTAHDQILDRTVRALLLRSGRVHEAQDAARRAALVTDPRLLRVLDVGDHDGMAYVVTAKIPGRDLRQLTAHGPLQADQARAIIGEAAVALEVARRRGVHHLALRPSAIHVTSSGGVVVSGLAVDGELGEHGLGDARSTTRADTVGLVSLLYLALTGRWPSTDGAARHGVPAAPLLSGRPIAPAEIAPGVPNDLDTLCTVTLGPHEDGPHSPAELVRELEPWGAVTPGPAHPPRAGGEQDTAVEGLAPETVAAVAAAVQTTRTVARQSVWDVPATAPSPPGTPPPAIPPAIRRPDPRISTAAASAAATSTPADPDGSDMAPQEPSDESSAAPAAQDTEPGEPRPERLPEPGGEPGAGAAGGGTRTTPAWFAAADALPEAEEPPSLAPGAPEEEHHGFDEILEHSADVLVRKKFNPTPLVLLMVAVAVVMGVVLAWQSLTRPAPSLTGSTDGFVDLSQTPTQTSTPTPSTSETSTSETSSPSASPTPTPVAPVIASAQQVDPPPDGNNNEHPELVDRAIDGDPSTMWYSRTYVSPTYGMKKGIGFAIQLKEEATVSKVTLIMSSTGGNVEVRATTADKPTDGPVLASGPMSATTELTFDKPVKTSSLVLWFTALPQTADGKNRVELHEVQVQ
ncbi:murein biosynthesis integral membrane protein MurJ [Isoptericola sp. b490]|uniref:murein biosynthesis integral membrane protein MurJ n=1 Tax=Actinotalea lenta TaxID=3064654 RepID=UPI002712F82E|nr:murein biosynthesis integral membrane protein MurJ [Isoptericola sp. b490]MDO8122092.1 murein biosynthesis integral membrane protein MurJ [Isoptericola sp. b490]